MQWDEFSSNINEVIKTVLNSLFIYFYKNVFYEKKLWLLKKIVIIEKDHDYWKRLWLLKKIVIIEKNNSCNDMNSVAI